MKWGSKFESGNAYDNLDFKGVEDKPVDIKKPILRSRNQVRVEFSPIKNGRYPAKGTACLSSAVERIFSPR